MSSDPEGEDTGSPARAEELTFRSPTGDTVRAEVTNEDDEVVAPASLAARRVRLPDGTELCQLRVAGTARKAGYERLDNEILAGLRLREATEAVGYPPEVRRLHGYEATSAAPFALLEPYRGEPLTEVGQQLLETEQHQFQVSLLTGLCWLAAAGVAHRGIGPSTVFWDGRQAQITDFSTSTIIGAPREAIGTPPWAAPEQRSGKVYGRVGAQDDIWAAGRLIFYVRTLEELTDRRQLTDWPALETLLDGVFGPPEARPTARDLLSRLNEDCPVPRGLDSRSRLEEGRKRFYALRASKHPGEAAAAAADETVGEPDGAARGPADQASAQASPVTAQADQAQEAAGQPRSARRLMRRLPLLMSMLAGGLATALVGVITLLVR
jgi:serine/threonine protein kinase